MTETELGSISIYQTLGLQLWMEYYALPLDDTLLLELGDISPSRGQVFLESEILVLQDSFILISDLEGTIPI